MRYWHLGWIMMAACVALPVHAQPAMVTANCALTPRIGTYNYPGARNIAPVNDLTRAAGKSVAAPGERLVIKARVLDKRCVPVQGAIVELWQADPFGKYRLATRQDLANPNPVFNGAGRTYTDNNGMFSFITNFPAGVSGNAPRVNLRVAAPNMGAFTTVLFFENDARNAKDGVYRRLSADARRRVELRMQPLANDPNAGFAGVVDIVLPGTARYRSY